MKYKITRRITKDIDYIFEADDAEHAESMFYAGEEPEKEIDIDPDVIVLGPISYEDR